MISRIAAGRGTGEGSTYLPWLIEGDVPSTHGHMERFRDSKSDRYIVTFSTIELHAAMFYDAQADVVGMDEQFPLDREMTRRIARRLGIEHPRDPRSHEDIVITTDLVVRFKDPDQTIRKFPRGCKPHSTLDDYNHAEHGEIERVYWREMGWQWKLVTDSPHCMPPRLIQNLESMKAHRFAPEEQAFAGEFDLLCIDFVDAVARNSENISIGELAARFQTDRGLREGEGARVGLYLMHKQRLQAALAGPPLLRQGALEIAAASGLQRADEMRRAA